MKKESLIIGVGVAGLLGIGAFFALRADDAANDPSMQASTSTAQPLAADATGRTAALRESTTPMRKSVGRQNAAGNTEGTQGGATTLPTTPAAPAPIKTELPAPPTNPTSQSAAAVSNPSIQPAGVPVAPMPVNESASASSTSKKIDEPTLKIKEDTVIGIRIDQTVSTDSSHVDDRITARVIRDVTVEGHTAIPSGARLEGVVSIVERMPHTADRRRLGIRFTTLILPDNKRVAIQTDPIYRDSDVSAEPSAALAGGALGAMLANGGRLNSSAPMSSAPRSGMAFIRDARIPGGTPLTVRLTAAVTIEK